MILTVRVRMDHIACGRPTVGGGPLSLAILDALWLAEGWRTAAVSVYGNAVVIWPKRGQFELPKKAQEWFARYCDGQGVKPFSFSVNVRNLFTLDGHKGEYARIHGITDPRQTAA